MPTPKSRVQILVDKFTSSVGLPFQNLLPESMLEEALVEEKIKYRNRLFSPIVTLWAFLSQVLDTDKTCHNAVSRIIAWLAGVGLEIPLALVIDVFRTHDVKLARRLYQYLNPGDVLLGDRAFC